MNFGGFEQILNASVDDFVHSILFTVLHALMNAYNVKKTSPSTSNFFRLAFSTIVLAMGGSILTSFLLGNPQPVFFSARVIPTYSIISWVVSGENSAVFREIDHLPQLAKTLLFLLIDALSRGFTLPKFLTNLRSLDCPLVGQFVLGVAAIAGGGLLYNWFIMKNSYKIGGYAFKVVCIVVAANIFFMEVMESDKTSYLHELRVLLENYKLILSSTESKIVTSYAIYIGFLSQPYLLFPKKTPVKAPNTDKAKPETPKTPKSRTSSAKKPDAKSSGVKKTTKTAPEDSDDSDEAPTRRRRSTRVKKE